MKKLKLSIAVALLVGVVATAGHLRNPSNPPTTAGKQIVLEVNKPHQDWPTPPCPPQCDDSEKSGSVPLGHYQKSK